MVAILLGEVCRLFAAGECGFVELCTLFWCFQGREIAVLQFNHLEDKKS